MLFSGFIQGHVGDQPGKEGPAPVLSLHGGGGSRGAGERSSDGHSLLSSGCCFLSPCFPGCVCVDGPRLLHVSGGSTAEPPGTWWRVSWGCDG